jgi:hypothetical protein
MMLTRKDAFATGLTGLAVVVFLATHESWNVPLVGGSHRWAAGAILLLGILACGLGSPDRSGPATLCAVLGTLALVLGVLALVTGSLTPLSLLLADTVLLWAISTVGHIRHEHQKPLPA